MSNVIAMSQPETDRFQECWLAYPKPRREKMAICKAKWNAITGPGLKTRTFDKDSNSYIEIELHATPDEIIAAVKKFAERHIDKTTYKYKDDGKFICQFSTWLNQGRWLDE